MTTPPPGPWPPPPPGPGQQPPSWGSQPPWGPPPQRGGNRVKWILGGVALVVVIGLTVVATLLVTRDGSGSGEPTASAPPSTSRSADFSKIASAGDTEPVTLIAEEPTCSGWAPIAQTLVDVQRRGWNQRDAAIPASKWTAEQRRMYGEVASAMNLAADETVALALRTEHRVMREIYEQTIAYWRAYADATSDYVPQDDHLAAVANGLSSTVTWICAAIDYGSAPARILLLAPNVTPIEVPPPSGVFDPKPFINEDSTTCSQWHAMVDDYRVAIAEWQRSVDPAIPAGQWIPEQQRLFTEMVSVMGNNSGEIRQLGVQSRNPVWRDFASLAGAYRDAYVQSIPTYVPADNYLDSAASELVIAIDEACHAVGQ